MKVPCRIRIQVHNNVPTPALSFASCKDVCCVLISDAIYSKFDLRYSYQLSYPTVTTIFSHHRDNLNLKGFRVTNPNKS